MGTLNLHWTLWAFTVVAVLMAYLGVKLIDIGADYLQTRFLNIKPSVCFQKTNGDV